MHTPLPLCAALLLCPLWHGCSDGQPPQDAGTVEGRTLEVLTPPGPDVGLRPGAEQTLRVRYLDLSGTPVGGAAIHFAIFGDPHGSTLSSDSAATDSGGVASIRVHAGAVDSRFRVQASAAGAKDANFYVEVSDAGFGAVSVSAHYQGLLDANAQAQLTKVVYSLYGNIGCASIDPFNPPPALRARSAEKLSQKVTFESLPLDLSHTIAATAHRQIGTGHQAPWELRAVGCVELPVGVLKGCGIESNGSQPCDKQLDVSLLLLDQLPKLPGTYNLISRITLPKTNRPLEEALAPWVDLTDCPLDPEQLLLDCILDAVDGKDPLDCLVTQPSAKTLPLLAERGALAGGCRAAATDRGTLSLEQRLRNLCASGGQDARDALEQVESSAAEALREVLLDSVLKIQSLSVSGEVVATHRLNLISFVSLSPPNVVTFQVPQIGLARWLADPVQGSVGPVSGSVWSWQLLLQPHLFSLSYGLVTRSAMGALVLQPAKLPATSSDLAAHLADLVQNKGSKGCAAIEPVLCEAARLEPGCLGSACLDGQTALATHLDSGFVGIDAQPTDLTLEGTVQLIDNDGDLIVDGLGQSTAPGKWTVELKLGGEVVTPQQATFIGKP